MGRAPEPDWSLLWPEAEPPALFLLGSLIPRIDPRRVCAAHRVSPKLPFCLCGPHSTCPPGPHLLTSAPTCPPLSPTDQPLSHTCPLLSHTCPPLSHTCPPLPCLLPTSVHHLSISVSYWSTSVPHLSTSVPLLSTSVLHLSVCLLLTLCLFIHSSHLPSCPQDTPLSLRDISGTGGPPPDPHRPISGSEPPLWGTAPWVGLALPRKLWDITNLGGISLL